MYSSEPVGTHEAVEQIRSFITNADAELGMAGSHAGCRNCAIAYLRIDSDPDRRGIWNFVAVPKVRDAVKLFNGVRIDVASQGQGFTQFIDSLRRGVEDNPISGSARVESEEELGK